MPRLVAVALGFALASAGAPTRVGTFSELRAAVRDASVAAIEVTENVSFASQLLVNRPLAISGRAAVPAAPTLSGQGRGRLFRVAAGGALALEALVLADGAAATHYSPWCYEPPAVRAVDGEHHGGETAAGATDANAVGGAVDDHEAATVECAGGAVYVSHVNASLALTSVVVRDCAAYFGGAVAVAHGRADVTDSRFVGNRATSSGGALIVFDGVLDVTAAFEANAAPYASDVYKLGSATTVTCVALSAECAAAAAAAVAPATTTTNAARDDAAAPPTTAACAAALDTYNCDCGCVCRAPSVVDRAASPAEETLASRFVANARVARA
jgi:hypothetical protein